MFPTNNTAMAKTGLASGSESTKALTFMAQLFQKPKKLL